MDVFDRLLGALGLAPDGTPVRQAPEDAQGEHEAREAAQVAMLTPHQLGPSEHRIVVDMTQAASRARYKNGKSKRTRYPVVDLRGRKVVAVLHQAGFTWKPSNPRHALMTAHDVIRVDAAIVKLHPYPVRLVAANRLDRAPWHAINLEVVCNAEGVDGTGDWFKPEVFGRGRSTDAQIDAAWEWLCALPAALERHGAELYGVAPHIVSGRDKHGKPNRGIDPGSRIWSEVGERAGAELGLRVPAPGWSIGGAPVPESWHGRFWPLCRRFIEP